MARLNKKKKIGYTYERAKAAHISPESRLRRSVMACMLWEDEFYEDGMTIADRIVSLVGKADPFHVANMTSAARNQMKLRHVPLLMTREMARLPEHKKYVADSLADIIQRPDELAEFLAIYWKNKREPLGAQVKKGLARAFTKFDAYQLAKYNRKNSVKLKDVLFLCHAKPRDKEQEAVWKQLIDGTLKPPDTWEVGLSSGKNKKAVWERLLAKKKLGAMAVLRNLRNFREAGVKDKLVIGALKTMKSSKVLPFRFIAAARYAPCLEKHIEKAMLNCLDRKKKLAGHTVLLIDVSGSMEESVSRKSEMSRLDAAAGIAIMAREICKKVDIFTFSEHLVKLPARRGFALRDAIVNSQPHGCTYLGGAVRNIYGLKKEAGKNHRHGWMFHNGKPYNLRPDRLIVFTDEQSHDPVPDPVGRAFMVNVASAKNGVGYGSWFHIDGWSEAVIDYIREVEGERLPSAR